MLSSEEFKEKNDDQRWKLGCTIILYRNEYLLFVHLAPGTSHAKEHCE
jgi:hypothetical protein